MIAAFLIVLAAFYTTGTLRLWRRAGAGRGIRYWQVASFAAGWGTLVVALASPLDEWSETLFAAHMVQHELLMVVAAPLIAFASPLTAMAWTISHTRLRAAVVLKPVARSAWTLQAGVACALHAVALWIWHVPPLYDAALAHESVHAIQHMSFFGTGVLFWWLLAHGGYGRAGYGAAVLYLFATALHSGFLGAVLTLSPRIWYAPYADTTSIWQLSALEDQQIAGLIMWIPASLVFGGGALGFLLSWLRESERRVESAFAGRPTTSHVRSASL